jgi:NAD(P)-dependent dehydrogenase (short-subunit alcohol dehydrogenase family)
MIYSKVLILGAHSSIASFVLPELNFDKEIVYAISRYPVNGDLTWIHRDHIFISEYPFTEKFMSRTAKKLTPCGTENILVINFAGIFGEPAAVKDFVLADVLNVLSENLIQFLSLAKLFSNFPSKSFLIGFSGGGVGGENMDGTSLGYLLSKISLAAVTEILDRDFKEENKRLALIAPGPFPSIMQQVVANAPDGVVSEISRKQAAEVQADSVKITKLANAIKWLAENPSVAGGRTWSAQRDDFSNLKRTSNFGLLRRIIN